MIEEEIFQALNNPRFIWRTVRGLSAETSRSQEEIKNFILEHGEKIIRASKKNKRGEELFADRNVYRNRNSTVKKISSALTNNVE